MNYRRQKQVIIGLLTLIVVSFFSWGMLAFFGGSQPSAIPATPSFEDVGSNGGNVILKPLEVVLEVFFEASPGIYDAVALIKNSNRDHGASSIVYEFVFRDEDGKELHVGSGKTFILPNRDRYVVSAPTRIDSAMENVNPPSEVLFRIVSVEWERLHPFSPLGLNLKETKLSREEESNTTRFSGIVENRSSYNLQDAEIKQKYCLIFV